MAFNVLKLAIAGDSSVGKTSLVNRYIKNTFEENSKSTIIANFLNKEIELNGEEYRLFIWDTAGLERYGSMNNISFNNCDGALFVYEIGNKESFENIPKWMKICKENSP